MPPHTSLVFTLYLWLARCLNINYYQTSSLNKPYCSYCFPRFTSLSLSPRFSFNLVNVAEVKEEMATEQLGTIRARAGELFLQLPLTENLTEDTGAGKLILTSVRSVLLTRKDYADKHRVYEAKIEGKGKDYVFLALTPVCVRELKLCPGMSVEVRERRVWFTWMVCVYGGRREGRGVYLSA